MIQIAFTGVFATVNNGGSRTPQVSVEATRWYFSNIECLASISDRLDYNLDVVMYYGAAHNIT